ncbi:TetR/AcrR family transcriptional regulator [Caulobacter sp.]|uniref:TetR/AcrR family transcriptional regulator n=1 Tax=Caulobacter sp. TaxID=78 RepID=UPI003BA930E1
MIQAAAALISDQGAAEASARAIAAAAEVAPSAINYNFGNIERLLSSAFARGAEQTAQWMEARTVEIAALPRTADGAARALEHVIIAWTTDERSLALLYQEALNVGAGAEPCAGWTRQWRDFWISAAGLFGLSEIDGRLLHLTFESEALYHLSTWSPGLERAVLRDLTDHVGAVYLGAPHRIDSGALPTALTAAGSPSSTSIPPAAMRIAIAAAQIVETSGFSGLTQRAVASKAGVTTGSVTHHFRTIEDLVTGAIRGQVQMLTDAATLADGPALEPITLERMFQGIARHVLDDPPASPLRRRLFLAAVRRPDLAGAGAIIRFSHGGTTRDMLAQIGLAGGPLALHSGLISRFASALWFACSADEAPRVSRERLFDAIAERSVRALRIATHSQA